MYFKGLIKAELLQHALFLRTASKRAAYFGSQKHF